MSEMETFVGSPWLDACRHSPCLVLHLGAGVVENVSLWLSCRGISIVLLLLPPLHLLPLLLLLLLLLLPIYLPTYLPT